MLHSLDLAKFVDVDGDGLHDDFDEVSGIGTANNATNGLQTPATHPDVDPSGGDRDWRESSTQDNDGDGVNDIVDLDDDNDGILDTDEDLNDDGDNDPRTDPSDSDGDGVPNYFDLDSDNDGITDYIEGGGTNDNDGNGQPGDGVLDATEVNSVGIPLDVSPDVLITGTNTTSNLALPNTDNDLVRDFLDKDSDNDGIVDAIEAGGTDSDGDGEFGSGTANDIDSDGLADAIDPYDDRDGNVDTALNGGNKLPLTNSDTDSIPNHLDLDSDNDGIPDNVEAQTTIGYIAPSGTDTDKDGLDDNYDTTNSGTAISPVNTDGTDNLDYLDLDSDNDLINDIVESGNASLDTDGDGDTDGTVGVNGLDNTLESTDNYIDVNGSLDNTQTDNFADEDADVNSGGDVDYRDILDADGDGVADAIDLDDDNDGILDTAESPSGVNPDADADNDGIQNFKDPSFAGFVDSNNDGINDNFDFDLDGLPNHQDTDSDNDSCPDVREAGHIESATNSGELAGTGYSSVNGQVTGFATSDGYTLADTNNTAVNAAQDPVIISTPPSNQSELIGQSATFSVVSTGNTFQWQESTDNGATFTNITNGGQYSGATTKDLTISNLTASENGYQYKVVITKSDYACDAPTTSPATLTVNNNPPVAVDDLNNTTNEDTAVTVSTIGANDTDVEDTTPVASTIILIDPNNASNTGDKDTDLVIANVGTYALDPLGNVVFTPVTNFNGTANINYTIKDSSNLTSNEATIGITVDAVNDPPVAVNNTGSGLEGATVTISTIGANDNDDADGGTVNPGSIILIDPNNAGNTGSTGTPLVIAQVGTYTVNAAGTVVFTPLENFNGPADIKYTIADNDVSPLVSNQATLDISITSVNDAPVANPDTGNLNEDDTQLSVNAANGLLDNDSDVDGNPINVTKFLVNGNEITVDPTTGGSTTIKDSVTNEDIGTITINRDGSYVFVPVLNFNGTVPTITYTVSDGASAVTSTLIITVNSVNDAPVNTVPGTQTTNEDTDLTITGISATDVDENLDNTNLTVSNGIINIPTAGGATITGNGTNNVTISGTEAQINAALASIEYSPNTNFNGSDTLTVLSTDSDGTPLNDSDDILITVSSVNDIPVNTVPGTQTTNEETLLQISGISATDNDGDLTSTELNVSNGTLTAVPSGAAVVTSSGIGNLLITGTETDINATLASLGYNPSLDFVGQDTLTVLSIDSNNATDTDIVLINVTNVNDEPVNTVPATQTTPEETVLNIAGISATDVDGNLQSTQVSVTNGIINVTASGSAIVSSNGSGNVTITGTETDINATLASVSYTPNSNYVGQDTLTVLSTDSDGENDTDIVLINVTNVNDAPVNTVPGLQTIVEETLTAITGISATDIDGDLASTELSVNNGIINVTASGAAIVSNNASGSVTISGSEADINATLASLTYTPNLNYVGSDILTVVSTDSFATPLSDTDTIAITVTNVNDEPVADNESVITNEDTPITIDVLDGDTDGDNDTLTISEINGTAITEGQTIAVVGGTVTLTSGELVVTPANNNTNDVTFNYTVSDGNGGSDTGSVNVEITPQNDGPIAVDDNYSTAEETTVTLAPLTTGTADSDIDGDSLTISSINGEPVVLGTAESITVSNGIVNYSAGGVITFTPNTNYNGTVTFPYIITDGNLTATANQIITVTAINDAPVAVDDSYTTDEDTAVVLLPLTTGVADSDIDGDTLSIQSINGENLTGNVQSISVTNGTVDIDGSGTITFTPDTDYNGTITFPYVITDGNLTATANQIITVNSVNDTPTAVNDTLTVDEDSVAGATNQVTVSTNDSIGGDGGDADNYSIESTDTAPANGTVTEVSDGVFEYIPNADFNGTDSFTYTITDVDGDTSTATVNVTVNSVDDAPTATDDTLSVAEDSVAGVSNQVTVSTNDNIGGDGGDADNYSIESTDTAPTNGTVTEVSDGIFEYIPNADFNGTDSFTYTITDADGDTATATVNVTVISVNDTPSATNDSTTVAEDSVAGVSNQVTVSTNDSIGGDGGDADNYSIESTDTAPTNGTVTEVSDGVFEYIPNANFNGTDSFTYTITDVDGDTATATVTVTVNSVDDAPSATDDTLTVDEDSVAGVSNQVTVSTNDSIGGDGGDADNYSIESTDTAPANGIVTEVSDGVFEYIPNADFNGIDSFTYTITDADGDTATATVNVTVNSVNDVPTAVDDALTVDEDSVAGVSNQVTVSTNDSIGGDGGDTEDYSIESTDTAPTNGTVTEVSDGVFEYIPNANFNGTDSFTYTITDADGDTATATVNVTVNSVNDAPTAVDDALTVDEDSVAGVSNQVTVSTNDSIGGDGGDADNYSIESTDTAPANGTVTEVSDGVFEYIPNADFNGTDSFTYTITDADGTTSTGTVTVTVEAKNDAPKAEDDSFTTDEDTLVTITPLTTGTADSDIDGDTIVVSEINGEPVALGTAETIVVPNGIVNYSATGVISFTPSTDYNGTVTFPYQISDGNGETDEATITIIVNAVNDLPIANDDTKSVNEDTVLTVTAANGLIKNDTDEDKASLTIQEFTVDGQTITVDPTNGGTTTINNVGDITINANGSYTFSPVQDFEGNVPTITYVLEDNGNLTDEGDLDITVNPINDNPVAVTDTYTTNEETPVTLTPLTKGVADSDVDGDTIVISEINGEPVVLGTAEAIAVPNGTLNYSATGVVTFSPNTNFNGTVTFPYEISDGNGGTATANQEITVNPVNDDPVAVKDIYTTNEDTTVTLTPLLADTDLDNDALVISKINGETVVLGTAETITTPNGTVNYSATGVVTFTPSQDFNGIETFSYEISDGKGGVDTADQEITVTAVNDNPIAVTDSYSTNEDTPLTLAPLTTGTADSDVDNDTIVVSEINGEPVVLGTAETITVANGTVNYSAAGAITFTPATNFNGTVTFPYEISDGNGGLATANQVIEVNAVNDFPVAVEDQYTTNEDTAITLTPLTKGTADSDSDGDTLTITKINGEPVVLGTAETITVPNGTVNYSATGEITFTPNDDFNGTVTFPYTISDGNGATATANQVITIDAVNDRPVATPDTATTPEDTLLNVNVIANGVLDNDSDIDADTITVIGYNVGSNSVTVGQNLTLTEGVLNIKADGTFTFDPADDYTGNVPTITYTISDGNLATTSTLDIEVTPTNDAPNLVADVKIIDEDTTLTIDANGGLLSNDSDIDVGDSLTITEFKVNGQTITVDPTTGGTTTILNVGDITINADGSYTFTPVLHYNGNVPTITYTVSDNTTTANSTLNIEVRPINDAPDLVDDVNTTTEDTPLTVTKANGVLDDNDTDVENETLTVTQFTIGSTNYNAGTEADITEGKLTINADGSYVFTPAQDFNGIFPVITYTAEDSENTETATLTITVTAENDAPIANNDSNTTNEDVAITVISGSGDGLIDNDTDTENDGLSITKFTVGGIEYNAGQTATVADGIISISSDGGYTFTPAQDFNGVFPVVDYIISDGNGGTDTATLTLTVVSVNDNPIAQNDANSTTEDVDLTVSAANGVLNNDSDVDSNLTVTRFFVKGVPYLAGETASPAEGNITLNSDGSYTFEPTSNFNGTYPTITYTASDNIETVNADLVITVIPANDTPIVVADTNSTNEGVTLTVPATGILGNDSDIDTGDTLKVIRFTVASQTIIVDPTNGGTATITNVGDIRINEDGSYVFTPFEDYNGTVPTITYTASDGQNSANTTLIITVDPVNDDPIATDDDATSDPVTLVNIPVLTNDSDVDTGDVLTVTITVAPGFGVATVLANGTIDYTPNAGFNNGIDTFTYQISDGNGGTDTAVVSVTVPESAFPPVANPDTNTTDEAVAITVADNDPKSLIANDTDGNLDPLTVVSFILEGVTYNAGATATITNVGEITINAGGGYVFTPFGDFEGTFPVISYIITDNQPTPNANSTLTITVNNLNDDPVVLSENETTLEDTAFTKNAVNGLLNNDNDIDGDALSISAFEIDGVSYNTTETANIVGKGSISITADGGYTFTPAEDFNGSYPTVTYTVFDGTTTINGTLDIEVTPVNDAPLAVNDEDNSTPEDTEITITAVSIAANDIDDNSIDATSIILIDPTNPTNTSEATGTLTVSGIGTYTVDGTTGDVTFDPILNYNGQANINYTIKDNEGLISSNTGVIEINVTPVNDAPVLISETNSTLEDTAISISPNGLLSNDTDVDGNPLSISTFEVEGNVYATTETANVPGKGSIAITSDGGYLFTPAEDFNGAYPIVTYNVTDGTATVSATLTITVDPVNDAPVAVDDENNTTNEDNAITVSTIGTNDTDDNGIDATSVILIDPNDSNNTSENATRELTIVGVGTYSVDDDGDVTFTPVANYNGTADINYTIKDNDAVVSNIATVEIEVTAINDAPVANPDTGSTNEDTALSVTAANGLIVINDTDIENDALSVESFTVAGGNYTAGDPAVFTEGTLVIESNGSYIFTPATDFNGTVPEVTYTITDGTNTANSTLNIDVIAVNDAPVAVNDEDNTTTEDNAITVSTVGGNDTDDNGIDATTVILIDPNDNSRTSSGSGSLTITGVGTYVVNTTTGDVTFTPVANYNGDADVNYTIKDNDGVVSNIAIIEIEVTAVNDAPVANPDTGSTDEDTTLSVDETNGLIVTNDTDIENNTLTVQTYSVSGNSYNAGTPVTLTEGTLVIQPNGSYEFTPALNFNGSVPEITYTITDGTNSDNSTLNITVNPINDAPVAINDENNTTLEDTPITVSAVGGNDLDDNGINSATVLLIDSNNAGNTSAGSGELTIVGVGVYQVNSDGDVTFTPELNYNGNADVNYSIKDDVGVVSTNIATIEIEVTAVNDAPVANPDTGLTVEDTVLSVDKANGLIDTNDTDPENNDLDVVSYTVSGGSYTAGQSAMLTEGTLVIQANGSYIFTPAADFNGSVPEITYTISDGTNSDNSTLNITVTPVNDAPIAVNDEDNTTIEDTPITVSTIGANDTDDNSIDVTSIILIDPNNAANNSAGSGELTIIGVGVYEVDANGNVTFTPEANYFGNANVNYTIKDGDGVVSNVATIEIEVTSVNDMPVANPDTAITAEEVKLTVTAANGLIVINDTDIDNDPLNVTGYSVSGNNYTPGQPAVLAEGTLIIKADGSFEFTPVTNFNGLVPEVTYTISDGTNSDNSTLNITVTPVNDAPVAVNDINNTIPEDNPITVALIGDNDTDDNAIDASTVILIDPNNPSNNSSGTGELTIIGIGVYQVNAAGDVTFTPETNYNGSANVNYTINDDEGLISSNVATIEIEVTPVNDVPVLVPDVITINEGESITVDAANGLLSNDFDPDGDPITITEFTISGTTYPVGTTVTTPEGEITIFADGSFTFTPSENYNGTLPVIYTSADDVDISNSTLTIEVLPVNDAPEASNDTVATDPGIPVIVEVIKNDVDVDGDVLTVSNVLIAEPSKGTVVVNSDGTVTYTPDVSFIQGTDVFAYQVCDADGLCDTATVIVTVPKSLFPPIASADTNLVTEDVTLNVDAANGLIKNDVDPNVADILTVTGFVVGGQSYNVGDTASLTEGDITILADGSYTFIPALNYNGLVPTINYTITDSTGTTDSSSTLNLVITAVNDIPVAEPNTKTILEDTTLNVDAANGLVLTNDSDADGTSLPIINFEVGGQSYNVGQLATFTEGTIIIKSDGSYIFTPALGYNGTVQTITYTITDGIEEVSSTLIITVIPVNDAPIVVDNENNITTEDTPIVVSTITDNDSDDNPIDPTSIILIDPSNPANTGDTSTPLVVVGVGTYEVDNLGNVTFTPEENYTGTADVNYTISDGTKTSNIGTVEIEVTPINDAPIAVDDVYTTPEDTTLNVIAANGLLSNDSDVENTPLSVKGFEVEGITYTLGQTAMLTEGNLNINSDGSFIFVPANNFEGSVPTVTYTVSDGINNSTALLDITVAPIDDAPIAVNDTNNTTAEDTPIVVATITSNDSDENPVDASSIILIDPSNPSNTGDATTPLVIAGIGTYEVDNSGNVTFTPAPNYNGPANVNYTISDGVLTSNVATVQITVTAENDAPTVVADVNTTPEDTAFEVLAAVGLLSNDSDAEGTQLSLTGFTINGQTYSAGDKATLTEGDLTINSDGSYTFIPTTDFNGAVPTVTYIVSDGIKTSTTTLDITVTPENDAPKVVNDISNVTSEDTPLVISTITNNDTDDDPIDPSTITLIDPNNPSNTGDSTTLLVVAGVGTYEVDNLGNVTFTPEANYNGTADVNYTISDGLETSNVGTIEIEVSPVNDAPNAVDDVNTTPEDTTLVVLVANGLLSNDSDNEGTQLIITGFEVNGSSFTAGQTATLSEGSITINGNGEYTFVPAANFDGTVPTITYTVSDGTNNSTAVLDITVTPIDDAPVVINDENNTTPEDTAIVISTITNNDLDENVIDPLTITLIDPNNPANTGDNTTPLIVPNVGTYSVDEFGNVTFTPVANFNGTADVNYTISDGTKTSNIGTIEIEVTGVNDAPTAVADVNTTPEDVALNINAANGVLANDSDLEGTPLTVLEFTINGQDIIAGQTATFTEGTLVINSDGSYIFTPALNYVGTVPTVTYSVTDGKESVTSTLDLTVTPIDDAPTVVDDFATGVQNTPIVASDITSNDSDLDSTIDVTSIVLIDPNNPSNTGDSNTPLVISGVGTFEVDAAGNVTFTPEPDFTGVAEVNYTVEDTGNTVSEEATIYFTVQPDNDGDGIANIVDLDDDNDGIPDTVENNGLDPLADSDNDGIPNYQDSDAILVDENNDGIDDRFDTDNDGIIDQFDLDSDGDGILDIIEAGGVDANNDGRVDNFTDTDNDGLDDNIATSPLATADTDGDGIANYLDLDSDGDGILDSLEGHDPANYIVSSGVDSDNDGIDDAFDVDCTPCGSITGTPIVPIDSDTDGLPNYLDLDSDNDGIIDNIEWQTTPGYQTPGADMDGNGVADNYETTAGSGVSIYIPVSTNGVNPPDYLNLDSDGDGVSDTVEAYDTDGDNVAEIVASGNDTDNDGIDDAFDLNPNGPSDTDAATNNNQDVNDFPNDQNPATGQVDFRDNHVFSIPVDTDGDGVNDDVDIDDDNDGILDSVESLGFVPTNTMNDPSCIFPTAVFKNPTYVTGTGTGSGTLGAKYRFENVIDVTGLGAGGLLDAIIEITDIQGGASLITIDNGSTGSSDAWQPEFTVPVPTGANRSEMAFKLILVHDNTNTQYNISRFGGTIYDIDGANARESVILSRPGLYAVAGNTLLNVNSNPATGLVTFEGPDDTYSGVDLSPRLATYFNYYDVSAFEVRFSAELLSTKSNTNLGSILFDVCSINGLFDGNTTSTAPSQTNGTSENSGPGIGVVYNVFDGIDSDGDGITDELDIDSDNDGIPDNVEAQLTSAYFGPGNGDSDLDGLLNAYDNANNSGLALVDTDGDLRFDYLDTDSDNDGIDDTIEAGYTLATNNNDTDHDGLLDEYDDVDTTGSVFDVNDELNNGASTLPDANTSTPEVDYREILDSDGDGITDSVDLDDDNDGILDTVEQDGDPLRDTDNDGIIDSLDLDSDNDGINDLIESNFGATDANNDGIIDGVPADFGANGLFDGVETTPESGTTSVTLDTDGDGIPNFQDIDDDNDGINTEDENYDAANNNPTDQDSDGDNIPDYLDTDDDNDGVLTADEDNDNDGIFLNNDDDDNGDGIPDYLDALDTDGDGIPDSEDTDDDNDGNPDTTDTNPLTPTTLPDITHTTIHLPV